MKMLITRTIITFAVSVAAIVGYWMWYTVISNKSADVAGIQSQITAKTETISRIALARSALSGIEKDENIVRSYFVSEEMVVSFINDLEMRGKAQGTGVEVISVSTKIVGERPTLLLSLSINGTFDSVLRTVGVIEYAPYDISISDFSIGKDEKNVWHANVKILVGSVKTNTP